MPKHAVARTDPSSRIRCRAAVCHTWANRFARFPSTGLVSGTVSPGATNAGGAYTVTITVSDGTSTTSTGINWTVNSAITITPIPDQTNNEGDSVSLQVHATDATSGTTLAYSASGLPNGLSIDSSSGLISGTIALGAANAGPYTPTITVSDGTSSASTTLNWTVNSAITISQPTNQVNDEGDTVSLQINATDATSGATMTYMGAGLPLGLAIDSSTGLISGTIALGTANTGPYYLGAKVAHWVSVGESGKKRVGR